MMVGEIPLNRNGECETLPFSQRYSLLSWETMSTIRWICVANKFNILSFANSSGVSLDKMIGLIATVSETTRLSAKVLAHYSIIHKL